jgi:phosphatidylserine/phosphatidylglycerophosphate/cardiolipin synthase-like enzyme
MDLFKTSKSIKNFANKVMNELIAASKRGVMVEVFMEKNNRPEDDLNAYNHSTATKLRKAGIEVRFDSKNIITHTKLIIIDERLVFIGSHNLTHTALSKSNETSLMVNSKELADVFLKYIHNQVLLF